MKVKITGCSQENCWYSEMIGEEFEVLKHNITHYVIKYASNFIDSRDCVIISEEEEMKTNVEKLKENDG